MKKNKWVMLVACIAVVLAGCGDSDKGTENRSSAASQDSSNSAKKESSSAKKETSHSEEAWQQKAQAYIKFNNRVNGFRNSRSAKRAEEQTKKGDYKSIRTDSHYFGDSDIKNLKSALALPGNMPEVDAAGTKLLEAIEKYVPNWKALMEYNKSKKFEDDDGAQGKEMLPMYIEGMNALHDTVGTFGDQVSVIAKQSHEKALAKYKAEGKLLEMHTLEALGAAEKIIDIFTENGDLSEFKDQSKVDTANALLEVMEKNLEGMKTEHAKRKENNSDRKNLPLIDRYDSVQSKLVSLAGSYREARKNPRKFESAIKEYNEAIRDYNMMQR